MKIGWRDIGHLAIIGTAGAVGVAATAAVVSWAEGTRDRVHAERATVTVHAAPQVYVSTRAAPQVYVKTRGAHQAYRQAYVRGQVQEVAEQVQELATKRRSLRVVGSSLDASPIVYVDGIRVNGPGLHPTHRAPGLDDLAAEDIAGVEVVKGEKALEYGTEAKDRGVILVTTKKTKKGKGKKEAGEGAEKGR